MKEASFFAEDAARPIARSPSRNQAVVDWRPLAVTFRNITLQNGPYV